MKKIILALALILASAFILSAKNPVNAAVWGKSETLSGTLTIVAAADQTIYVKSADGISYDFHIGPATKIMQGDTKLKLDDLTGDIGKSIEVVFRPLKTGNAAVSVELK